MDLSSFHGEERDSFVAELRRILHAHGFFYLTGHGIEQRLVDEVLATSKRFFALPMEEKLTIEMIKSPHFRGYNRAGQERTRGEKDWREQLDIDTEGEAAEIGLGTPWKWLQGPNQWPEALPELKPILLAYQAKVTVPGTFVINTGELLELATNGFVRADVHDVVAPPAGVERFSVAFFLGSRPDATIPVIELPEDLQESERGVTVDPLNPIFREVGINQPKSRLRSHPDVAEVHHSALAKLILSK